MRSSPAIAEGQISFLREAAGADAPHEQSFILANARPGACRLIIDGAPADYDTATSMLNEKPVVTNVAVACGGSPVAGVAVQCGALAGATTTISWVMQDADSPGATIEVGYTPLSDGQVDLGSTRRSARPSRRERWR